MEAIMTLMAITFPRPRNWTIKPILAAIESHFEKKREARRRHEAYCHERALGYARQSAEALERERPGSVARLDEGTLDISLYAECALAQIYRDYRYAPKHLRCGPVGMGFKVPMDLRACHMNAAWRIVIREYRTA
jgi:hypothetical protein